MGLSVFCLLSFATDAIVLCFWIPHFCGMTIGADAIILCFWFSDGMWEGHSALDAESSREGFRDDVVLHNLLQMPLSYASGYRISAV